MPVKTKGKFYRTVIRPAMLYGIETVGLSKAQEKEIEVTEMRMLRFVMGVTRKDKIRNAFIRVSGRVAKLRVKLRIRRLSWLGHVKRREPGYVGRRLLEMEIPGKRRRGRPKRRWIDTVKEDLRELELDEEEWKNREEWRRKIRCGDPEQG